MSSQITGLFGPQLVQLTTKKTQKLCITGAFCEGIPYHLPMDTPHDRPVMEL